MAMKPKFFINRVLIFTDLFLFFLLFFCVFRWTLDDSCGDTFQISAGGVLSVKTNAIDYEDAVAASNGNDPIHCTVTARVVDNAGAFDTMVVAVKIADVNEAPTALNLIAKNGGPAAMTANTDCWTYENASLNTVACGLSSTDLDIRAIPSAQTHAYSKTGGTGNGLYGTYNNPATVALFGSSTPVAGTAIGASVVLIGGLDFETSASYSLRLKVTDSGSQRPFSLSKTNTITIYVKDVNEAPLLTNLVIGTNGQSPGTSPEVPRTVKECKEKLSAPFGCTDSEITADGRDTVGAAVSSSDPDDDTTTGTGTAHDFGWTESSHKYSLAPADSTRNGDVQDFFTIDVNSGQIMATVNALLDFESMGRLRLYVEVTDQNINNGWSSPLKAEGSLKIDLVSTLVNDVW